VRILVTGATGYVGGRLLAELARQGRGLRALTRDASRLDGATPAEVAEGDVGDRASLDRALAGVDAAYYLVHALAGTGGLEEEEQRGAETFAAAARDAGVGRIVYLGGLGRGGDLSPHLRSRHEVGSILRGSGVPTIEFRASIVIGDGSVSFDTMQLLASLPVVPLPHWVRRRSQPIGIDDLLAYLVEALDVPLDGSEIVEIGGADTVSYQRIIEEIGRQRGTRTRILPLPALLRPLHVDDVPLQGLAPERARVVARLLESLRFDTTVRDARAAELFSGVRPRGLEDAVAAALS
jgi:uncharacterized protein YbjT (DUF2867 family)